MIFTNSLLLQYSRQFTWGDENRNKIVNFMMEDYESQREDSILDFGCGNGIITRILADKSDGFHIVGADIQKELIEEAQREQDFFKGKRKVEYITKDLKDVSTMDSYDLVYSHFFLVDCMLPELMFRNMLTLLKKGGRLCCFEPIYQIDGLNMYLPFLSATDKAALMEIQKYILLEIPRKKGIKRDFATQLAELFLKNNLTNIKIELITSYEIIHKYSFERKRYIVLNSNRLLKSKDNYKNQLYTNPLFSQLSELQRKNLFEIEVKIAEMVIKNPEYIFNSCCFMCGQMMAIRGNKEVKVYD
jgi:2-polyprenyl-3-methyl-5-hydroxy-6-metoxy-1,4-benzoquinol methylase